VGLGEQRAGDRPALEYTGPTHMAEGLGRAAILSTATVCAVGLTAVSVARGVPPGVRRVLALIGRPR
jgi:hypothetical protein